MDDEQMTETPTEAAPAQPETTTGSPLARPLPTYITTDRLEHDGVVYLKGAQFTHPDPALIAELRKLGTLALPEELMAAEDLAHQARAREEQLRQQQAEIEALKRQIAVLNKGGKGR